MNKRTILKVKIKIKKMIRKRGLSLSAAAAVLLIFALFQNCGVQTTPTNTSAAYNTALNTTSSLALVPTSTSIAAGSSVSFAASGGSGSGYTYSLVSGTGTINSSGLYIAPNQAETDEIEVTDSSGDIAYAWVYVSVGSTTSTTTTSTDTATITFHSQDGTGATVSYIFYPGTYTCSTSTFGSDPDYGHVKGCYFNSSLVVTENGTFTVSWTGTVTAGTTSPTGGTVATVSYKAQDGSGATLTNSFSMGTYVCSNTTFGSDPASGHVKACYAHSTLIAVENGSFTVDSSGAITPSSTCSYTNEPGVVLTSDEHCLLGQLPTSLNPNISGNEQITVNGIRITAHFFYYYGACNTSHYNNVTGTYGDFVNSNNATQCIWGYASGVTCINGFVHNMGNGYIGFYCQPD